MKTPAPGRPKTPTHFSLIPPSNSINPTHNSIPCFYSPNSILSEYDP